MSKLTNVGLTDEQLQAKHDRLVAMSELPVSAVNMGQTNVTLGPRNIEGQLRDVLWEMNRRGLKNLSEFFQSQVPLRSIDPRHPCGSALQ